MLIGIFIIILVGVVLIDSIANSISEFDDTFTLPNNESITWGGNNTAITLANDDIVANTETVYNHTTKLTRTTDYIMTSGSIRFINASDPAVAYDTTALNITYAHEGDNFLSNTTSRTLINLVILFFALSILAVGYHLVIRSYKDINL